MKPAQFEFIDRKFEKNLVLAPGWAADARIFSSLNLPYNYILPVNCEPEDFSESLLLFLDQAALNRVDIFGWSMGGFLACDFAGKHPERTSGLALLNIRIKYNPDEIEKVKDELKRNMRTYLFKFYLSCFSPEDTEGAGWFRKNLLKKYLAEMNLGRLLAGLDYLAGAQLKPEKISGVKDLRIYHGAKDKIAPLEEAKKIAGSLPDAEFKIFKKLGHVLFLNATFNE